MGNSVSTVLHSLVNKNFSASNGLHLWEILAGDVPLTQLEIFIPKYMLFKNINSNFLLSNFFHKSLH